MDHPQTAQIIPGIDAVPQEGEAQRMHHLGREFKILKSGCFPGSPAVKNCFEIFAVSRDFDFQAVRPHIAVKIPETYPCQLLRRTESRGTNRFTVCNKRAFLIIQQSPPLAPANLFQ